MTKDEILNMPAGQDMDLLISQEVLRLTVDEWNTRFFRGKTRYSTDMSAAWEVVERSEAMQLDTWISQEEDQERNGKKKWSALIYFGKYGEASGDSAPLAICRAALLAVLK